MLSLKNMIAICCLAFAATTTFAARGTQRVAGTFKNWTFIADVTSRQQARIYWNDGAVTVLPFDQKETDQLRCAGQCEIFAWGPRSLSVHYDQDDSIFRATYRKN